MPSEIDIEFCLTNRPDLDVKITSDSFRDFWIGVPGVKGKKLDWAATWRNWVRSQRGKINGNKQKPTFTALEDNDDVIDSTATVIKSNIFNLGVNRHG
jgi:hypothetical protein